MHCEADRHAGRPEWPPVLDDLVMLVGEGRAPVQVSLEGLPLLCFFMEGPFYI